MTQTEYKAIENHMLSQMRDSAHDMNHIYRVLYSALDIAAHEGAVHMDILIAACLLHDIGREKQFENLELCHAEIGGEMAYDFLLSQNWDAHKAGHVRECVSSHRYRRDNQPKSIEAKILFDADKLDVCGAIGIARTFAYGGQIAEPIYILDEAGNIVTEGGGAEISSFFQEYNYKLKKVYDSLYTERAKEISRDRKKTMTDFYNALHGEITENHHNGVKLLSSMLN